MNSDIAAVFDRILKRKIEAYYASFPDSAQIDASVVIHHGPDESFSFDVVPVEARAGLAKLMRDSGIALLVRDGSFGNGSVFVVQQNGLTEEKIRNLSQHIEADIQSRCTLDAAAMTGVGHAISEFRRAVGERPSPEKRMAAFRALMEGIQDTVPKDWADAVQEKPANAASRTA